MNKYIELYIGTRSQSKKYYNNEQDTVSFTIDRGSATVNQMYECINNGFGKMVDLGDLELSGTVSELVSFNTSMINMKLGVSPLI